MLSYRHAYHAGNHADLLKHLVLVYCLDYLTRKPAPLCYIDTHSGAGLYPLDSAAARKTGEAAAGIGRLQSRSFDNPLLNRYLALVAAARGTEAGGTCYPGSPWLAAQCLRPQDRLVLTELHSTDFPLLQRAFRQDRRVRVAKQDGFERLLSELPVAERRAFVLIDPSYEVKADYEQVLKVVSDALRKMPTAVIAVWLPVVDRRRTQRLEQGLCRLGRSLVAELGVSADSEGRGMTASSMVVLNPPWGLDEALEALGGDLLEALGMSGPGHFRVRQPTSTTTTSGRTTQ
ncbi:MAG: 23S rRNA (adenine(2030)-N(6))-methyltransferase RlmJ [Saccharospirillum sp.]